MKKILSTLLLLFAMLLSACGGVKYELKDGVLYGDGKEASGTFEFKLNGFKAKGTFVNGLADGLFERYYPDGSIFIKDEFKDGTLIKEEIFYKSGETLATATDGKYLKLFDKDGRLVESYDADKDKNIIYHENGKPLIITIGRDSTIYNENSEILSKEENGEEVNLDMIIKNVGNGLSEIIMDDKVIAKMDDNTSILTYFYSTGEPMITTNSSTAETQFFFKNGSIFFKSNGKEFILYHKDGKPIHELNEGITKYYNENGDEILMNSYKVEDIKKID
ncbi:cytoplasmic protein [Fusobacterium pseudoperiodonticum]|uniref:cytoplasmic protein n=1 Tax=Fusobacterium pseudoperiodonticum TaxID=2663009 RepID=UPI000C1BB546|nr:cytoplasmic protein [Fusobacterium pseudoperiodonticum]ATV68337.1 cytoplasmic protein [Fusobacterium pseudoperiodonticum]